MPCLNSNSKQIHSDLSNVSMCQFFSFILYVCVVYGVHILVNASSGHLESRGWVFSSVSFWVFFFCLEKGSLTAPEVWMFS